MRDISARFANHFANTGNAKFVCSGFRQVNTSVTSIRSTVVYNDLALSTIFRVLHQDWRSKRQTWMSASKRIHIEWFP